jgi:LMBR1 domain-containing protein 1
MSHLATPFGFLAVVAIKGNFLLGLNFLIVSLYPIRVGATLMSSFLVNTALILAMSCAVIQFCASAFSAYASDSMIFGIFESQVRTLAGFQVQQLDVDTGNCKQWWLA